MKNSGLIIKIAVGVSAIAVVFSLVTLIRSIVIRSAIVFPVIQLVGSAAIFAVCFLMLRSLKANGAVEEEEPDETETDGKEATAANEDEAVKQQSDADDAADEIYQKYNLSEFEE